MKKLLIKINTNENLNNILDKDYISYIGSSFLDGYPIFSFYKDYEYYSPKNKTFDVVIQREMKINKLKGEKFKNDYYKCEKFYIDDLSLLDSNGIKYEIIDRIENHFPLIH